MYRSCLLDSIVKWPPLVIIEVGIVIYTKVANAIVPFLQGNYAYTNPRGSNLSLISAVQPGKHL